jgi:hypothetical protein
MSAWDAFSSRLFDKDAVLLRSNESLDEELRMCSDKSFKDRGSNVARRTDA